MSEWIVLALLAAICIAIVNLATKQVSNNSNFNEYSIAWLRTILALPVLWISLYATGIPIIDNKFWLFVLILVPLEVIGALCYYKGLRISPLSLITPVTSFNVLFTAIGAYLILGEQLTIIHVIAVLLFVLGLYVLNFDFSQGKSIFEPFKKLTKERGVLLVFIFTLLIGINIPLQKIAYSYASPQFFAAVFFSITTIPFTFLFLTRGKGNFSDMVVSGKAIILMGLFNGLYLFASVKAMSLGKVAFVTVIVSLNILLTVLLSGAFFKEKNLLQHFLAGLIMLGGVALIALNP